MQPIEEMAMVLGGGFPDRAWIQEFQQLEFRTPGKDGSLIAP